MFNFRNSPLLPLARKAHFKPSMPLLIIMTFVIFYISQLLSSVPLGVLAAFLSVSRLNELGAVSEEGELLLSREELLEVMTELLTDDTVMLASLFLTATTIVVALFWCKLIEKRPLSSMGFVGKGALKHYTLGLAIGFVLFLASFLISLSTNALTFGGVNTSVNVKMIVLFFFAFLIQGASEEILLRGCLMMSASNSTSLFSAVLISSVTFSFLHSGNTGVNILAFLNIILFGVFMALYMLRSGNIWGACAIHSMWNFAQGNIFGCSVSGMNVGNSILLSELNATRALTNGGEFGPEGGVAVTLVLVIAIMIVVYLPAKKNEQKENAQ